MLFVEQCATLCPNYVFLSLLSFFPSHCWNESVVVGYRSVGPLSLFPLLVPILPMCDIGGNCRDRELGAMPLANIGATHQTAVQWHSDAVLMLCETAMSKNLSVWSP